MELFIDSLQNEPADWELEVNYCIPSVNKNLTAFSRPYALACILRLARETTKVADASGEI